MSELHVSLQMNSYSHSAFKTQIRLILNSRLSWRWRWPDPIVRAAESGFSSVKHHSVLLRPPSRAQSSGPPTAESAGSGVNVAIIGLLSTSAAQPNAGGSLSQPPVVHYGPHSALIRANPPWWAPARALCQHASSTQAAVQWRRAFQCYRWTLCPNASSTQAAFRKGKKRGCK